MNALLSLVCCILPFCGLGWIMFEMCMCETECPNPTVDDKEDWTNADN